LELNLGPCVYYASIQEVLKHHLYQIYFRQCAMFNTQDK